ncbi:hypothetical protein BVY03_00455 [bacterium K02(2017)]|nr:hypothetical protein BVY03_00455 [bacterium K02(2017)]
MNLFHSFMQNFLAQINGDPVPFLAKILSDGQINLERDGHVYTFTCKKVAANQYFVANEVGEERFYFSKKGEQWHVLAVDQDFQFELLNSQQLRRQNIGGAATDASGQVISPMPGKVIEIKVKLGQKVKIGQDLLVIEAMKMQNVYKSKLDGKVNEVCVSVGDSVEKGQMMVSVGAEV